MSNATKHLQHASNKHNQTKLKTNIKPLRNCNNITAIIHQMGQERRELSSLETMCLPQTQMMANAVRSSEHSTEKWSRCAQKSNLLSLSTQTINKNKERKRYQMRSHVALQRAQKGQEEHLLRQKILTFNSNYSWLYDVFP